MAQPTRRDKLIQGLIDAAAEALLPDGLKELCNTLIEYVENQPPTPDASEVLDTKLHEVLGAIDRFETDSREVRGALARIHGRLTALGTPERLRRPLTVDELAHYRRKARTRHQNMPVLGFTGLRVPLTVEALYVPLTARLNLEIVSKHRYSTVQTEDTDERPTDIPLIRAFGEAAVRNLRGVVLLGNPGSGKTTHLKQVLLQALDDPTALGLHADTLPVFLPLQELRDRTLGMPGFINDVLADPLLDLPPSLGQRLCERDHLLFLFDGLDEVADADERAEVSRWIAETLGASNTAHVLVSCRFAGYTRDVALPGTFLELELSPLGPEQMQEFVRKWYTQVARHERPTDPTQAAAIATRKSDDLLAVLSSRDFKAVQRVYEMTHNPLLLTAICLVHHDQNRLPDARAELYAESIRVLLHRWKSREQHALPSLGDRDVLQVLQPIAAWMHGEHIGRTDEALDRADDRRDERGRKLASRDALRGPIAEQLARIRKEVDADHFLTVIRDETGLLTGMGVDVFAFMHLGFQEFLTAKDYRERGHDDPATLERLAERFGDAWWEEVILLMLALPEVPVFEKFMRALTRRPDFADLVDSALMTRCFTESARKTAAPFVELLHEADPRPWWARLLRLRQHQAESLAIRQRAAARLLAKQLPDDFRELTPILTAHPSELVRNWWIDQQPNWTWAEQHEDFNGIEFVVIPKGEFMMGSPESEGGDEWPQHRVELDAFELARTPVTNAQYRRYLEANPGAPTPKYWADQRYNQDNQPVVGVSWHEAVAYCTWAGFVLPTEAQWEYACRAKTNTRYCSGDDEAALDRVGWYSENSQGRLHAVAEKQPNAWGLYDMHGNVWEWCRDGHGASYDQPVRAGDGLRREPDSVDDRVVRGGSFVGSAGVARSAVRYDVPAGGRGLFLGLRPARVISGDFTTSPPVPSR